MVSERATVNSKRTSRPRRRQGRGLGRFGAIFRSVYSAGILVFATAVPNVFCHVPEFSELHDGFIMDVKFSGNGKYLFVQELNVMSGYDLTTGELVYRLNDLFLPTAVDTDGGRIAVADDRVNIIDVETGRVESAFPFPTEIETGAPLASVDFVADDRLVIRMYETRFHIADLESGDWHIVDGLELAITPSGRMVVDKANGRIEVGGSVTDVGRRIHELPFRPEGLFLAESGDRLLLREVRLSTDDIAVDVWHVLDTRTMTPLQAPWIGPRSEEYSMATWFGGAPLALYSDSSGFGIVAVDVASQDVVFRNSGSHSFGGILSPDGQWMAVDVIPFDLEQEPHIDIYRTTDTSVPFVSIEGDYSVESFSDDGNYLLVSDHGTDRVRRYDLSLRKFDRSFAWDSYAISGSDGALSSDGSFQASLDLRSWRLEVADAATRREVQTLDLPVSIRFPHVLKFAGAERYVILAEPIWIISVLDLGAGTWRRVEGMELSMSTDGRVALLSESEDIVVRESYRSPGGEMNLTLEGRPIELALAAEGDRLAVMWRQQTGSDGVDLVLQLFDALSLRPLGESWIVPHDFGPLHEMRWVDGRLIAVFSGRDGEGLSVFDVSERTMIFSLPSDRFSYVRLSPNGRSVGVVGSGGLVEVYSLVQQDRETVSLPPRLVPTLSHGTELTGVSISADASVVATVGEDGAILLWDGESGRMFRRIEARTDPLSSAGGGLGLSDNGAHVLGTMFLVGEGLAFVRWEVATGTAQRVFTNRRLGGTRDTLVFDDGDWALLCGVSRCSVEDLRGSLADREPRYLGAGSVDRALRHVSLSPDNSSVALASYLEDDRSQWYIEWAELEGNRRWTYTVPDRVGRVHSVAALGDTRVAVSASDRNGPLLLVLDGKLGEARRAPAFAAMVALNDARLAAFQLDRDEMLILSSRDMSLLRRFASEPPIASGSVLRTWLFPRVATTEDGRWIVTASSSGNTRMLDTTTGEVRLLITSDAVPARRVEFDTIAELLLVDGGAKASLWDLSEGRVVRQILHDRDDDEWSRHVYATLVGDTVFYISPPDDDSDQSGVESWSARHATQTLLSKDHYAGGIQAVSHADGSRSVAVGVQSEDSLLLNGGATDVVLLPADDSRTPVRIGADWLIFEPLTWNLHETSKSVLVDFGYDGVRLIDASDGTPIWLRDDLLRPYHRNIDLLMWSADANAAVLSAKLDAESNQDWTKRWFLVLDAATGATRFTLSDGWNILPVVSDNIVHGLLRFDAKNILNLSMHDGSVVSSVPNSLVSPHLAIANRTGSMFLIVGAEGALLWNIVSGEYATFDVHAEIKHQIAFSPDGRLLASVDSDGTVSLWQVGSEPPEIDQIARLVTFSDGDWAVVAPDGRYDASDPADLETLSWIISDAPTDPVPLAIFFREYYEPQLLTRLLSGEVFPRIRPVDEVDREQPRVAITDVTPSGDGTVSVTLNVTKGRALSVGDIKLFRNGRLVALKERKGSSYIDNDVPWVVRFDDIALPTTGGNEIEFSAYAFNSAGIKSETDRYVYSLEEMSSTLRHAFVIVVGINAYTNSSWDLSYAARDARTTVDVVSQRLWASGVFDDVHTVTLIAEREHPSGEIAGSATRADFLTVLRRLRGDAVDMDRLRSIRGGAELVPSGPDDLVFIAFFTHGVAEDDGVFHLFMSDIGGGKVRVVNNELLERTVGSDLLEQHLRGVDAGEIVMVVDTCNAAAIVEGRGFKPGPMGSRGLGQLAYDKAMRVLAASHGEGEALEYGGEKHGLLSLATVLEGLEQGEADRFPADGAIDFAEMLSYGVARVPTLYDELYGGDAHKLDAALAQFMEDSGAVSSPPPTQRPRFFDFGRSDQRVRLPVVD